VVGFHRTALRTLLHPDVLPLSGLLFKAVWPLMPAFVLCITCSEVEERYALREGLIQDLHQSGSYSVRVSRSSHEVPQRSFALRLNQNSLAEYSACARRHLPSMVCSGVRVTLYAERRMVGRNGHHRWARKAESYLGISLFHFGILAD